MAWNFSILNCSQTPDFFLVILTILNQGNFSGFNVFYRQKIDGFHACLLFHTFYIKHPYIDGLHNMSYSERLQKLDLPTLRYRRLRGDIIEIFKHVHSYDASIVAPSFQRRFRPSRKHGYQLHEPVPRDGIRGVQANSFHYRVPVIWNNLPRKVVEACTLDTFKNRLDKLWENQPMKYDHRATLQIDL